MKLNHQLFTLMALFAAATAWASENAIEKVSAHLVDASGDAVEAEKLESAPKVLFYYSAHWCPPCRIFTPKLVEFYKENGGGEAFEIVFVSSDRSESEMLGYMEEEKMPWLAVDYANIAETEIKSYGGPYIPALVMFDADGNLIAETFDASTEEYYGPQTVLAKLSEML